MKILSLKCPDWMEIRIKLILPYVAFHWLFYLKTEKSYKLPITPNHSLFIVMVNLSRLVNIFFFEKRLAAGNYEYVAPPMTHMFKPCKWFSYWIILKNSWKHLNLKTVFSWDLQIIICMEIDSWPFWGILGILPMLMCTRLL